MTRELTHENACAGGDVGLLGQSHGGYQCLCLCHAVFPVRNPSCMGGRIVGGGNITSREIISRLYFCGERRSCEQTRNYQSIWTGVSIGRHRRGGGGGGGCRRSEERAQLTSTYLWPVLLARGTCSFLELGSKLSISLRVSREDARQARPITTSAPSSPASAEQLDDLCVIYCTGPPPSTRR